MKYSKRAKVNLLLFSPLTTPNPFHRKEIENANVCGQKVQRKSWKHNCWSQFAWGSNCCIKWLSPESKSTAQVVWPDVGDLSMLVPNSKRREGTKWGKASIFILSCQSGLFPHIKLPGKEMKVPASWQEAGERASSIQLELDSIKFKKRIPSKAEHH